MIEPDRPMDNFDRGLLAALALGAMLIMLIAGTADYQAEVAEDALYCEMVESWDRTGGNVGWPPYRGREICEAD